MTGVSMLAALLLAEPVVSAIRSHHARIVRVIDEASRRSVTFRALVDRLNQSDVIIYIESGRCPSPQVLSCVAVASTSASYRYLRVTIETNHSLQIITSQIAHELQHTVEIAEAPEVVDSATLRAFYRRIGTPSVDRGVYETANAIAVAARVAGELTAPTAMHDPPVTKEQQ
jgi:hypothetical protein